MTKLILGLIELINHPSLKLFNHSNFWAMILVISVILTMISAFVIISREYLATDKFSTTLQLFVKSDPNGMWPFKFLGIVFFIGVINYLVLFLLSFWYIMVMTLLHVNTIGHGWMALLFSMALISMFGNMVVRKSIRLRLVMASLSILSISGMLMVLGISNLS